MDSNRGREMAKARYGYVGPRLTACARCGHSSNIHKKDCRDCECKKWVGGKCSGCSEWCFSWMNWCADCYKAEAAEKRAEREAKMAERKAQRTSPEFIAQREDKRWLRQGQVTLTEVRRLLHHPVALQSARVASTPDRTSHA